MRECSKSLVPFPSPVAKGCYSKRRGIHPAIVAPMPLPAPVPTRLGAHLAVLECAPLRSRQIRRAAPKVIAPSAITAEFLSLSPSPEGAPSGVEVFGGHFHRSLIYLLNACMQVTSHMFGRCPFHPQSRRRCGLIGRNFGRILDDFGDCHLNLPPRFLRGKATP